MVSVNAALSHAVNDELDRQRNKIACEYAQRAVDEIKRFNKECTAHRDDFKRYQARHGFACATERHEYSDKLNHMRHEHAETLDKLKRAYQTELCYRGLAVPPDLDLEV